MILRMNRYSTTLAIRGLRPVVWGIRVRCPDWPIQFIWVTAVRTCNVYRDLAVALSALRSLPLMTVRTEKSFNHLPTLSESSR
jgi:hypothetical protein